MRKKPDTSENQDKGQKLQAMKLLSSLGYVVLPEVFVTQSAPVQKARDGELRITDLDAVGFTVSPLLRMSSVAVDCTTESSVSAVQRALRFCGVLELTEFSEGIIVLKKEVLDAHRAASTRVGISVFSSKEFEEMVKSLPTEQIDARFDEYLDSTRDAISRLTNKNVRLGDFVQTTFWMRPWNRRLYSLADNAREIGPHLRPDDKVDVAAFYHLSLLYSLVVTHLCTQLFYQQPKDVPGSIRSYVYGGSHHVKWMEALLTDVHEIIHQVGAEELFRLPSEETHTIDPPYFNQLCELIHRLLAKPASLKMLMQTVQLLGWKETGVINLDNRWTEGDMALSRKLALDLLRVFGNAIGCSSDFLNTITDSALNGRKARDYPPKVDNTEVILTPPE